MTRIEQHDRRIPGLATQVKTWFDQGISARAVVELLRERYHIVVPKTTVSNFRTQRWARERTTQQRRQVEAAAAAEFARMRAMKGPRIESLPGMDQ